MSKCMVNACLLSSSSMLFSSPVGKAWSEFYFVSHSVLCAQGLFYNRDQVRCQNSLSATISSHNGPFRMVKLNSTRWQHQLGCLFDKQAQCFICKLNQLPLAPHADGNVLCISSHMLHKLPRSGLVSPIGQNILKFLSRPIVTLS